VGPFRLVTFANHGWDHVRRGQVKIVAGPVDSPTFTGGEIYLQ
jgi:hypothetical protein